MRNQILKGIFTLFMIALLGVPSAVGQQIKTKDDLDKKALKWYKEAISEGRKRNYKKSLKLYDKLIKKHPEFVDGQLRKAGMLHNIKEYDKSAMAFEKAIAMAPEYEPLAYFSLAIVYKDMKLYDKASNNFGFYLQRAPNGKKAARAKELETQTAFAHDAVTNPVPFEPKLVSGGVNTSESEYAPVMMIEGDRMIFTRRVRGQEDFFVAAIVDGEFTRVAEIENLNTPQNEGVHTISADGRYLIFTACDRRRTGMGSCDLYATRLDAEDWDLPRNMGPVINSIQWDAQPSLSADGKKLFFSSSRKDGHGGNDIWMTTRTDTKGWEIPKVLPSTINTARNEESPFIHPDGHTLYFRSNGRVGMGGFDIYYSRYIDSTDTWSEATNIGYPINTEGSEGAMTVSLDGTRAFFASDMAYLDDRENANLDIYSFDLYPEARPMPTTFVKAKIIDSETKEPLKASYSIEILDKSIAAISGVASKRGSFITSLPTNADYAFFVEMDGYLHYSKNFALTGITTAQDPLIMEIELTKAPEKEIVSVSEVEKPAPIILNNIFFESGSAILLAASDIELDRLAANLIRNSQLRIEILGHTDNVGSETDNQILSDSRAKSVAEALIARGISRERISYRGLGESQPIADNDTEEGRKANRRTEFVIKS